MVRSGLILIGSCRDLAKPGETCCFRSMIPAINRDVRREPESQTSVADGETELWWWWWGGGAGGALLSMKDLCSMLSVQRLNVASALSFLGPPKI